MKKIKILILSLFITILNPSILWGSESSSQRFAQMVFTFPKKHDFTYFHNSRENRIDIEIRDISPKELQNIEQYDEKLIKRILIKDTGGSGVIISLFLRDYDVRALINSFDEPFRITIDLFDKNFAEMRDPATKMPFVQLNDRPDTSNDRDERTEHQGEKKLYRPSGDANGPLSDHPPEKSENSKLKLLGPSKVNFHRPDEIIAAMNKLGEGPGSGWKEYPIYIYRINSEIYKTGKNYDAWIKQNSSSALDSNEQMAKFAEELFNFGHEGRSLVAYQQVLHKDRTIFDREAVHLWNLAEIHFGQKNLILASGYYDALIEKHPDHKFANLAKMRKLDLKAIEALEKRNFDGVRKLASEAIKLSFHQHQELSAELTIRSVYWNLEQDKDQELSILEKKHLPLIKPEIEKKLLSNKENVENSWTGFLIDALVINTQVSEQGNWKITTGSDINNFVKNKKSNRAEPIVSAIVDKASKTINQVLQNKFSAKEYEEVIRNYESLPLLLRKFDQYPLTIWAIAESYRLINQPNESAVFYQNAAKNKKEGPDSFKAFFWAAVMANDTIDLLNAEKPTKRNEVNKFTRIRNEADNAMWSKWQQLTDTEKNELYVQLKDPLERVVISKALLKTPPKLVFNAWKKSLSTEVSTAGDGKNKISETYIPSASTVEILTALSKRFKEIGLNEEERQSRKLLTKLQPKALQNNAIAKEQWNKQLQDLAEEYRKESDYLEAGRLYALIGRESNDGKGSAESNYKGGLLLYRAGKRDEAIDAFKKASEDTSDLVYADLAKQRLRQLQ